MSKIYPTWRYHKTEAAKIIETAEEDAALGKGWADTPAAFEDKSQVKAATPEVDASAPDIDDAELSKDDAYEALISLGHTKKDLKGKTHEEMIALLKAE